MFGFARCLKWLAGVLALVGVLSVLGVEKPPALRGVLQWSSATGTVDADLEGWPLDHVLERIARVTHWRIFAEPGTGLSVTAKFKGLKTGEALRRLLGTLDFVLIPEAKGPPRLLVFKTAASAATELVAAPAATEGELRADTAIPNELIVRLKAGSSANIDALAKSLGATVVGRADDLKAYRLKWDTAEAASESRRALQDNGDVASVDSNYVVNRPGQPESVSGLNVPALNLRAKSGDDGRVVVGLIDTAVQRQGTALQDFLLTEVQVAGKTAAVTDQPTHGTSMAETLLRGLSFAPDSAQGTSVRILPVDVYGNGESTTTFEIGKGIYEAVNRGATIINLSLGGASDSSFVHDLIVSAHNQGVVFLASAGNEPVTTPTYPAAYPEVIAVTASTRGGELASYANRGDFVDVMAPGTSVVTYFNRSYVVVGTSPAAAYVSALAANTQATTGKTGAALEAAIKAGISTPKATP